MEYGCFVMVSISWPRRGPLFQRYSPLSGQASQDDFVVLEKTAHLDGEKTPHNKRFLDALKDGGAWLS